MFDVKMYLYLTGAILLVVVLLSSFLEVLQAVAKEHVFITFC